MVLECTSDTISILQYKISKNNFLRNIALKGVWSVLE